MLANEAKFDIQGGAATEKEVDARDKAAKVKKSEFALTHALKDQDWHAPRYIAEGLRWLAAIDTGVGAGTPLPQSEVGGG